LYNRDREAILTPYNSAGIAPRHVDVSDEAGNRSQKPTTVTVPH